MMVKKITMGICLGFFLTGCATVSSSTVDYVSVSEQTKGPIFITSTDLPEGLDYEVIGVVKANARQGYSGVQSLYPLLADEARKVGANAVINTYGGRAVSAFSWAAPYTGGTAIKIKNADKLKAINGQFY